MVLSGIHKITKINWAKTQAYKYNRKKDTVIQYRNLCIEPPLPQGGHIFLTRGFIRRGRGESYLKLDWK